MNFSIRTSFLLGIFCVFASTFALPALIETAKNGNWLAFLFLGFSSFGSAIGVLAASLVVGEKLQNRPGENRNLAIGYLWTGLIGFMISKTLLDGLKFGVSHNGLLFDLLAIWINGLGASYFLGKVDGALVYYSTNLQDVKVS